MTDTAELIERLREHVYCIGPKCENREAILEAADALEQMQWVSVGTRLPIDSRRVWFSWHNRLGNRRTGAGSFVRKFEVSADHEDLPREHPEDYDWKNEQPYRKPGWYEEPHESEYYYLVTDEVTHWTSLPSPPGESP